MAYNRWLSSNYLEHHGVKGQQWGVTNGPPYPLDRSKSDGHKLIKGDGSPQGKKKYTSSQKTAHKRAVRKNRAEATSETERDIKRLNNFFNSHVGWDNIDAVDKDGSLNRRLEELYNGVDRGTITKESFVKEASGIRDEIRRRIDAEASDGSEWAPEVQKHLKDVDTYHRGVDEDKYEMTFLEAIQNEDWEVNNDKKRRDKEYAEYLKDREGYFQKGNEELARTIFDNRFAKGDREKFISNISTLSMDSDHRAKQREFEDFLKNVPLSKKHKDLQSEIERVGKEMSEAEYRAIDHPADRAEEDLKIYHRYKKELDKLYAQQEKEACRLLGIDPSKISNYDRRYLNEMLTEAHRPKDMDKLLKTKASGTPKKSIIDKISSFRDRGTITKLPEGSQSQKEEAKRLLPKGNSVSSKLRKFAFVGSDGKLNAEGRKYYNVNGDGSLTFDELELRKEAVKNNNWDTFDKYFTMTEGLNTSKLSKADKAKKEKQLLSLWYKDQMTDRDGAIVNALYRRIAKESGSWYQGESVTDSFRKALEKERAARKKWRKDGYSKESASKVRSARRELSKAVLRDLGFEINSDNIELIEGWIIDD